MDIHVTRRSRRSGCRHATAPIPPKSSVTDSCGYIKRYYSLPYKFLWTTKSTPKSSRPLSHLNLILSTTWQVDLVRLRTLKYSYPSETAAAFHEQAYPKPALLFELPIASSRQQGHHVVTATLGRNCGANVQE